MQREGRWASESRYDDESSKPVDDEGKRENTPGKSVFGSSTEHHSRHRCSGLFIGHLCEQALFSIYLYYYMFVEWNLIMRTYYSFDHFFKPSLKSGKMIQFNWFLNLNLPNIPISFVCIVATFPALRCSFCPALPTPFPNCLSCHIFLLKIKLKSGHCLQPHPRVMNSLKNPTLLSTNAAMFSPVP